MNRFVELCVYQYYAEIEKDKLRNQTSASAINMVAMRTHDKLLCDIASYSENNDKFLEYRQEFDDATINFDIKASQEIERMKRTIVYPMLSLEDYKKPEA